MSATNISVFTEVRFGRTADGSWAAGDASAAREAWLGYLAAGAQVTLVGRASTELGPNAVALDPRLQLRPLPYYLGIGGLIRTAIPLARQIRRGVLEADTVVLRLPGAIGSVAAIVCKLSGRAYVADVVGDPADVASSGVLGRAAARTVPLVAAQMRWLVRGAAASRYVTRRALQARYPARRGTLSAGISDVRLGTEGLAASGPSRRHGRLDVVVVGSQETTVKGHDVLFAAMASLRAEGIPVTATLVGGGRMEQHNMDLATAGGVREFVRFQGNVGDRAQVIAHLDAADVFALPSRQEGLPRALVEAMARGLPAIATNVGGNRELLDADFVIDVDDAGQLAGALRRLYCDQALWQQQSARNLEVARSYGSDVLDLEFATWFRGLAGAGVSRGDGQ